MGNATGLRLCAMVLAAMSSACYEQVSTPGAEVDAALSCPGGLLLCDGDCIDARSDVRHCGDCAVTCASAHASPRCEEGVCGVGACDEGFVDLNGSGADGCEYECTPVAASDEICDDRDDDCDGDLDDDVYLAGDSQNCGSCGTVCAGAIAGVRPAAACVNYECTCQGHLTYCGGCVDTDSDGSNCGECGAFCPMDRGRCSGGECRCGGALECPEGEQCCFCGPFLPGSRQCCVPDDLPDGCRVHP